MGIEITNHEAYENLLRFQTCLKHRHGSKREAGQREYRVLFNRHTGEMSFSKTIAEIEAPLSKKREGSTKDWTEIRIIVTDGQKSHFRVLGEADRELDSFDAREIDRIALRVAKETVAVLNKKADEVQHVSKEGLLEEETLRDLSSIRVRPQSRGVEKLPGWAGALTRQEAEDRLRKERVGTYLVRSGDEETSLTVQSLAATNEATIEYYILTFKSEPQRMSEDLILCVNGGWILYKDEPILNSPEYTVFSTPDDLLNSIKEAKYPFGVSK